MPSALFVTVTGTSRDRLTGWAVGGGRWRGEELPAIVRRTFRRSVPQQQTVFAGFVPSLFSIGRKNGSPMLHAPVEDLPSIDGVRAKWSVSDRQVGFRH